MKIARPTTRIRPLHPGWRRTPPRALAISALALVVAGMISLLWPNSVEEYAGFVWILALIPVFLLSYYRGWQGAAAAAVGAMAALALFEVIVHRWLAYAANWLVVGSATVVLIPVTLGAGWLSERLLGHREEERRLHELAPVPIVVHVDGVVQYANRAALRLLGVSEAAEVVGRQVLDLLHPDDRPEAQERMEEIQETGGLRELGPRRYRVVRPDGKERTVEVDSIPVLYGHERGVQTIVHDITERVRMERQLERRALYDHLTGLPNRQLFEDRLGQALSRAQRHQRRLGVLFLDLDHFKKVNDNLGHAVGDRVLARVARRLESNVRDEDTVARFGGDEFAVLLEELDDREQATTTAERLIRAFNEPMRVEGAEFRLQTSVGVSLWLPPDGAGDEAEPQRIIRQADMAMFRAKDRGGGGYHVFDPHADSERSRRFEKEQDLQEALEDEEFRLHYQPIVRLADGSLAGLEPLVRWERRESALLGPADFLPLAEETGLIVRLGEVLLREACRELQRWDERLGHRRLRLHPNLSARQLEEPALVEVLGAIIDDLAIDPGRLSFELTESAMMQAPDVVEDLAGLGTRVVMDDFGTGYSSLRYLRELPIDGLKLDIALVDRIDRDEEDEAVAESIIRLADRLGLSVTAEGVEREEQAEMLRSWGCSYGQGHLFAPPGPADELLAWEESRAGEGAPG